MFKESQTGIKRRVFIEEMDQNHLVSFWFIFMSGKMKVNEFIFLSVSKWLWTSRRPAWKWTWTTAASGRTVAAVTSSSPTSWETLTAASARTDPRTGRATSRPACPSRSSCPPERVRGCLVGSGESPGECVCVCVAAGDQRAAAAQGQPEGGIHRGPAGQSGDLRRPSGPNQGGDRPHQQQRYETHQPTCKAAGCSPGCWPLTSRVQPRLERDSELHRPLAWAGAGPLRGGGPRQNVQERLHRTVHASLHLHPARWGYGKPISHKISFIWNVVRDVLTRHIYNLRAIQRKSKIKLQE